MAKGISIHNLGRGLEGEAEQNQVPPVLTRRMSTRETLEAIIQLDHICLCTDICRT